MVRAALVSTSAASLPVKMEYTAGSDPITWVGTVSRAAASRTSHAAFWTLVCSTAHRLACCAHSRDGGVGERALLTVPDDVAVARGEMDRGIDEDQPLSPAWGGCRHRSG